MVPDYSYISNLHACPRRHFYEAERNLASEEVVPVLHAGTAGHDGLEALHSSDWDVNEAIAAMRKSWGDYRVPRNHDHDFLSPNHLEVIIRNYADEFRGRPRSTFAVGSDLFAERTFTMDWGGTTVGGRIDLLEENKQGELYLLDWKFTTQWVNRWYIQQRAPRIDHQMRLYTAALQQELDRRLAGTYILGVYMGEKATDPPEAWESRKSSPFRLFGPFSFSEEKLKETRAWIEQSLREIEFRRGSEARFERAEYAWPQNTRNKYSCNRCDFESLCESSPLVRDNKMKSDFVEREPQGILASGADSDA